MAHLKRVPSTLLLQELRLKNLPDEPLGIVDGVLRVAVSQVHGLMSSQHRRGGEGDGTGDALPPLLICDHLHFTAARVEDADRAEGGTQVQADHFRFRGRQVLLAQITSQEQGQYHRTCGTETRVTVSQLNQAG